ncbi:oligosaccharide repeat unit polymerase [Halomonas sediminis]
MRAEEWIKHPLVIFIAVWAIIAVSVSLRVSTSFQDDISPLYQLMGVSIAMYSIGFGLVALLGNTSRTRHCLTLHQVATVTHQTQRFMWVILLLAFAIVALNLVTYGLPPFFGFLGVDTYNYLEYGRLKGILFALAAFIVLLSAYARPTLGLFMKAVGIGIFILYVSRGYIIFSLLGYFFLVLHLRNIRIGRMLLYGLLLVVLMVIIMEVVGHYRTGTASFFAALNIKPEFQQMNAGIVWLLAYISMPAINIIELTQHHTFFAGKALYSAGMPAFMAVDTEVNSYFASIIPNHYNTASGYLANVYLDFGWYGVALYNLLLGMAASAIHRFSANYLLKSIFLAATALMFFNDYFVYFTTFTMFALAVAAHRYLYRPARRYQLIE